MNKNPIERSEYVALYVTKDEKRRIEDAKDNHQIQMEIIKEIFTGQKDFLKSEYAMMDEELLKYRAYLVTVRQVYFEAQKEHEERMNEFWGNMYDNLPKIEEKVNRIVNELAPITKQLKEIDKIISDVNTWRLKDMLELVDKVSDMPPQSAQMFQMLIENFKLPK